MQDNKKIKIVFIGNVMMSLSFLKSLKKLKNIVTLQGIISGVKNNLNTDYLSFKDFARINGIQFHQTDNINSSLTYNWIKKLNPNYIFCFGFSQLIKKPLLKKYSKRIIGFHPSSLPMIKGRNPIIWSIILNRKFSGTNFFFITEKPDSGEIIDHYKLRIKNDMTATQLYDSICKLGQRRIKYLVKKILKKKISVIKNNSKLVMRKRMPGEEVIDWRMSSRFIHNLVRALSKPYIGACFFHKGKKYKVLKSSVAKINLDNRFKEYGRVVKVKKKGYVIRCGEGLINILRTEPKIKLALNENIY